MTTKLKQQPNTNLCTIQIATIAVLWNTLINRILAPTSQTDLITHRGQIINVTDLSANDARLCHQHLCPEENLIKDSPAAVCPYKSPQAIGVIS